MTAKRYTAVFTGLLSLEKPGEYTYLRMGDDPPGSGNYTIDRGRPPYGELGREISFSAPDFGRGDTYEFEVSNTRSEN